MKEKKQRSKDGALKDPKEYTDIQLKKKTDKNFDPEN